MTLKQREEAQALQALQRLRHSGRMDAPLPEPVTRRLLSERFAREDANGALEITARGEEHLGTLRRAGALRSGRTAPRRSFAERRGPGGESG